MTAGKDPTSMLLGEFIRAQRQLANLSLRQLSAMTQVSNPYLSQVERGLHEPSVRVLRSIAEALNVSAETLLVQAGMFSGAETASDEGATAAAIMADTRLSPAQRHALLVVYQSYVEATDAERSRKADAPQRPPQGRSDPPRRPTP